MDAGVINAMSSAASLLLQPQILTYLIIGVAIGTILSVIPGVGGLMGIALLLPFTFSMSANEAIVFLLGALAVMSTADSIPAILFGVPGTPTSMVTVLDGYPMAKRGEAGRAMGAAFTASVLGGIIGALILIVIIPISMPLLMGATSAELLAFCILGLAMVGALAGGSMAKGLGAAIIGVLLAFIGQDANTATLRWTFNAIYLWDGFHILIIALGIYALPELADLAILGKTIAHGQKKNELKGASQGFRDTIRNIWPVTRSSTVSSLLAIIPAIGPTVIPWLVYSYTTMTTRGPSNFGAGDVRGVIASESSNNACVGGALLPTAALGVPGSAPMALLLGAFLLHGIAPGPAMLTSKLDLTYMMVWAIVVANVIGGILALGLARPLSLVVFVRPAALVPLISVVVFAGALQSSRQWEDALFLLLVGALGWIMKRARWPRAPMFLAFILAPLVEKYFFISMNIHGWGWTTRPVVAVLLALTVVFLVAVAVNHVLKSRRRRQGQPQSSFAFDFSVGPVFSLLVLLACAVAFFVASGWPYEARIMPQIVSALGVITAGVALAADWYKPRLTGAVVSHAPADGDAERHFDLETDFGEMSVRDILRKGCLYILMLAILGALSFLVGVMAAIPVFFAVYMLVYGERPVLTAAVTVGAAIVAYVLFERVLQLAWPVPIFPLLG
ncbi:tripartite tricarboxylate transporter permease [Pseudorhodoplanes sp.]|uniref:tripartite tricarboxylate transporter permease n=1 Tax=Pseudorhodoplanes sp. TaxID=1934341 RepID=UPI00391D7DBD